MTSPPKSFLLLPWVETFHFAIIEETLANAQPVAMLGAAQRIEPEALARFAGKRVRIFPHLDGAGAGAALRWEAQLHSVKIDAHCYDLSGLTRDDGAPVKDSTPCRASVPMTSRQMPSCGRSRASDADGRPCLFGSRARERRRDA